MTATDYTIYLIGMGVITVFFAIAVIVRFFIDR